MLRNVLVFTLMSSFTLAGWAQQAQPIQISPGQMPGAQAQEEEQTVEDQLRIIVGQLDLTPEQQQHVDALFVMFQEEQGMTGEDLAARLEQIRATVNDREAAREAGDMQRVRELTEKLKGLAPGESAKRNFIRDLKPALTAAQRSKLERLLARMEGDLELTVTPVQVLRVVRDRKLTDKQLREVETLLVTFREDIRRATNERRVALLQQLVLDFRNVLTPEQRQQFDEKIGELDAALLPAQAQ